MIEFLFNINIIPVLLWCLPFGFILLVNEYLDKNTNWPREYHRKIGHVLSGFSIVLASYHLDELQMILFGICLLLGALGSRLLDFSSIHEVARKTIGTSLFPVSVIVLSVLWMKDNPELLRYGILILAIPDAAAAVIGSRWGRQIPHFNKSLLGSRVFFGGTILVTLFFTQTWWIVLLLAVTLTVVEFFSQWGVDNILLPVVGSGLLYLLMV